MASADGNTRKGAHMTTSTADLLLVPVQSPKLIRRLPRPEVRTPWTLYAALGFFLVGIVLKACSLIPVG